MLFRAFFYRLLHNIVQNDLMLFSKNNMAEEAVPSKFSWLMCKKQFFASNINKIDTWYFLLLKTIYFSRSFSRLLSSSVLCEINKLEKTCFHLASEWTFAWVNPCLVREIGYSVQGDDRTLNYKVSIITKMGFSASCNSTI